MSSNLEIFKNLNPELLGNDYVFCTFPTSKYGNHSNLKPIASFLEKEGLTLVIFRKTADLNDLKYNGIFKCISLNLVSSLSSIGLTAKISKLLAKNGISANVVAGYYHDHIFVPLDKAKDAFNLLYDI